MALKINSYGGRECHYQPELFLGVIFDTIAVGDTFALARHQKIGELRCG